MSSASLAHASITTNPIVYQDYKKQHKISTHKKY
uniref:Uncharacterized protein n=1 Tax=Anguilla anguilla TaxID=7936 RepID=A0A0E9T2Q4_ANGAN